HPGLRGVPAQFPEVAVRRSGAGLHRQRVRLRRQQAEGARSVRPGDPQLPLWEGDSGRIPQEGRSAEGSEADRQGARDAGVPGEDLSDLGCGDTWCATTRAAQEISGLQSAVMGSVNKVILVGNLGRDAELRYTPGGAAVAKFSLATTERWNDKAGSP